MFRKVKTQIRESNNKRRNEINKYVLGSFLFIAVAVLLARIITGALLDMGLFHEKLHPGFWKNPHLAFKGEYLKWLKESNQPVNKENIFHAWNDFLDKNESLRSMINHHPSFAWFLTQFTWLTTIIIIVYLTFRFFKFEDTIPRWLKWIMTQNTLSLMAMYELIVGVTFWSAMFTGFSGSFSESLYAAEMIITVIVHGVIPVCLTSYSIIFLIKDENASMLREFFVIKGLIFPSVYCLWYGLMTIVWSDPYSITNMNKSLNIDPLNHELLSDANWQAWASEIWKLPVALIITYISIGFMAIIHNFILQRFNKSYDINNDSEINKLRQHKLDNYRRKMIRKEARTTNKKNN